MMTAQLESALVRIFDADSLVVGTGFLVTDQDIMTCAHVVADALGVAENTDTLQTGAITIDFPLVAPGQMVSGQVILWQPDLDMAGLRLIGVLPDGARFVPLVIAPDMWGHAFRAYGFPAGYDQGVWASGILRGRQAAGWVQIEDIKQTGYFVAPGFSGGPVWDEQLDSLVGMIVAADTQPEVKAAFMIPPTADQGVA